MCCKCEEDCHPCACFETCCLCTWLSSKGYTWADENRKCVIGTALCTTILAIVLSLVAACAISTNNTTVKNTSWSKSHFDNYVLLRQEDTYIGLSNVVRCYNDDLMIKDQCVGINWDDTNCGVDYGNICTDCKDAATGSIILVITSLISQIPTIQTDLARLQPETDRNVHKALSFIQGILSFATSVGTAITFAIACYMNLNDGIQDYELGPGYLCLLMVLLIKPLNVFLHYLVPVPYWRRPGYQAEKLYDENYDDANYGTTELSVSKPDQAGNNDQAAEPQEAPKTE